MTSRVALLLHMHQPEYRDPESGIPQMPWVRLHASRGYTDVPALLDEHGGRATINVVPGLLDQLVWYRDGGEDAWERLSRVPAEDLTASEAAFLRRRFVHGHHRMRQVSARYRDLESRIGALDTPTELRDLQVWSNLAWMGAVGRRDPRAASLIAQDRDFDHEQLLALMELQRELVGGVLDRWSRVPELSCSPYDHPILPLLVDFSHTRRALPSVPAEAVRFAWPDDARRQVLDALDRVEELLGRRPEGMWPSEGAVSPEAVAILKECGVRWCASDQEVLERSERDGPADLRCAWDVDGVKMVFRDRGLSDRIGFVYANHPGHLAVMDLFGSIEAEGVLPLILDGENPWESYPDAGESFLTRLFRSGRTATVSDALARMPTGHIEGLHTGSWIKANLAIWSGHARDQVAWRALAAARTDSERG